MKSTISSSTEFLALPVFVFVSIVIIFILMSCDVFMITMKNNPVVQLTHTLHLSLFFDFRWKLLNLMAVKSWKIINFTKYFFLKLTDLKLIFVFPEL